MDFFVVKKVIGALLMPLPVCFFILILGLIALFLKRHSIGYSLLSLFTIAILLISTPFLPGKLLGKIEQQNPQYDLSTKVNFIVVLGCSHTNDARLPITSQIHHCSLARINEAVRIWKHNPDAKIVTSGAAFSQPFSQAEMNKKMLMVLGVSEDSIIVVNLSRDTEDEANNLAAILLSEKFALVTSASHIPRALRLFQGQNLKPIAAPTEHLVREGDKITFFSFIPAAKNIKKMERWWYETLGQGWLTLKSWFA
jgi:uncharacterized SAM-binding protein YcdF (DUF218 family)